MRKNTNSRRKPGAGRPVEEGPVHLAAWRARTEDALDRLAILLGTFIPDVVWRPAWEAVLAVLSRATERWPAHLAAVVEGVRPGTPEAAALAWTDEPRPTPLEPRRFLTHAEVRELLDGPRSAWPWPAPAENEVRRIAGVGHGIEIRDVGGFYEWDETPRPAPSSPPHVLRPLLEELDRIAAPASQALADVLTAPPPPKLPAMPKTAAEAREQYLQARVELTRARIAVRKAHRRREDLARLLEDAAPVLFARTWRDGWLGAAPGLAGDPGRARVHAERVREEALQALARLVGHPVSEVREVKAKPARGRVKRGRGPRGRKGRARARA